MIIVVESADELVILADSVVINFTWLHNESLGGLIIYIFEKEIYLTQVGLRKLTVHILKPNLRPNLPSSNYKRKVCLQVFARVQDDTLIIPPNLGNAGKLQVLVPSSNGLPIY